MYLLILFLLTKTVFADESYRIEGNANNVIIDLIDQKFEAMGGSTATFTNIKIEAKKITKDKDRNRIIAEGKITYLQDNRYKVVADTLELDLDKKIAKMKKGKTALNKFYLTGEDIEAKFPEKLIVNNATVTTCSHDRPHFHIKAKRVDFYPDSKFIGYKGWIYIGEKFRLFPVPIYGSYVTEKENRAPLFPKIDYDEKKGALVIYGIDFRLLDNKKFGPIDRINLEGLVNLEYSQNRGLGFNKIRAGYSAMDIFKGETLVEDWISAPTESEDTSLLNKENSSKNQIGTSYKFITRNSLKSSSGLAWKLKDGTYFLGNSNINFEYKNTNSDLIKDEYGRYAKKNITNKSSQTEIALEQKIWKYLNVNYKFRSIDASDEVIKSLFDSYDEKAEGKAEEDKYLMDTRRENNLNIVEDDFKTHRFLGELRRNFDIRPEKGKSDKSKIDNRDYLEGNFNKLGIKAEYENLEKDTWKRKYLSGRNENYLANEEVKKKIKVALGKYFLFGTNFNYRFNYEFLNSNIKTFDDPKDTYLKDDKRKQASDEYENRNKFLLKDEKFNYHSAEFQIKNDYLSFLELEKTTLAIEPIYSLELRKYVNEDSLVTPEEQEKYKPFNEYVDVLIHKLSYSLPFVLYDNSSYVSRNVDFKLTTTPKAERIFIQGKAPKGQKAPETLKIYGNQIDIDFGNTKTSYIFKVERNYDLFEDFLRKSYLEHEGSIKLEDLNLFTFQIKEKSEWDLNNAEPSNKFFQKYKVDFDYIGGSYKRNREKIFYRDFTTNNLKKEKITEEDEYTLTVLGITGKYSLENFDDQDLVNFNRRTFSERTKLSLEYEKEFKETYKKYKLKGSYQKELDKIKNQYKDSIIAFSLEFTDNSEVIKEKERKEEEARNIDLDIKENKKEIEKNEELLNRKEEEEKVEDEDPIDKEFESDEAFFVKEEEIDKILEEPEIKTTKTLMDLGEEFKEEKIEDKSKKLLCEVKLVSNSNDFNLLEFDFNNYTKNLKQINLRTLLKYSSYFEAEGVINNKRPDFNRPHTEYEILGRLKLQLGYKDYEWYPGASFKRNVKEDRWDEIFGTLDHNMHCTKISLKAGIAWNAQKKDQVFAFGLSFEIREFPEKNLGFTVKGNKVENASFGL